MIEISFWTAELVFAAIWLIVRIVVWIVRGRIDLRREAMLLLMYINLAVIIRFTFFPMALVDGKVQPLVFDASQIYPFKLNLIPFTNLFAFAGTKETLTNIIGNVAMFIPSGIVLPIVYKRLDSFWKTVAAGAAISLCIELIQLLFYTRTTDTNDLILNTLGVMIGYGIYALIKKLSRRKEAKDA